jgi:hypothetical protein
MAGIYGNAYFTIAASKGHDSASGCYSVARPQYMHLPVVSHEVHVRQPLPLLPTLDLEYGNRLAMADKFPIFWRAWIYQARCLSRRILHFAGDELTWECQTRVTQEHMAADKNTAFAKLSLNLDISLFRWH